MAILQSEGLIISQRRRARLIASPAEQFANGPRYTIYVIGAPPDPSLNPKMWFISDQVLRGIISVNTRNIIRLMPKEELAAALVKDSGPAAVIDIVGGDGPELYAELACPFVINQRRSVAFARFNAVNYDQITSAFNGVSYLLNDLGHRDVALIWGGTKNHQDNLSGYRLALESFGLTYRDHLVVAAPGGREAGLKAAAELLGRQVKFTAVFADTDLKAMGAIEHLRTHGLRVPEAVSVLGSDDIPEVSASFGLTTMRRPFFEIGQELYQMLEEKIRNGNQNVPSRTMPGTLIKRASCRANKSS
jgi:DNA-binding LacI/PurR family transcriptional regulator